MNNNVTPAQGANISKIEMTTANMDAILRQAREDRAQYLAQSIRTLFGKLKLKQFNIQLPHSPLLNVK